MQKFGKIVIKVEEKIAEKGFSKNRFTHEAHMEHTQLNKFSNAEDHKCICVKLVRVACRGDEKECRLNFVIVFLLSWAKGIFVFLKA